jgi:TolB-like protein/Tfp pilus assembly protein PilF
VADQPQSERPLQFGVFQVDFRSGELRKRGLKVKLQEKPLQVLEMLLANPGKVVTREELRNHLWPEASFGDFEHSINIAVTKLRQALGDNATNPRFIETLPRHGYRFVAPTENSPGKNRRMMLAVLPFANLGDDRDQDYFSDGLTEEMITELGRLNPARLGVIARTTSMHFRNSGKRADEIGRELGVQYILEGGVRKAANRVRITAKLIEVEDQVALWASTYDRELVDVLNIQSEVTRRIAQSLAMELLPSAGKTGSRAGSMIGDAHEFFLRGRYYWTLRTEESFRTALRLLEKAIELDPGYALAHAALADTYDTLSLYGSIPSKQAGTQAKHHAYKALAVDKNLAEAHAALGYALLLFDWDWKASEVSFKAAITSNPNYVGGHHWYALLLALLGRFDDAIQRMDIALQLDPLSYAINTHKGWVLYFARRYQEAVAQLHEAVQMDVNFAVSHYFLGLTYLQMSKLEDAIEEFELSRGLSGNHPGPIAGLGYAQGILGRKSQARRYQEELNLLATQRHVSPFFNSWVCLGLGDRDSALKHLERAFSQRCCWMAHLHADPLMDALKPDRRFQDILGRVGFPPMTSLLPK